jgi:hypothetical protein
LSLKIVGAKTGCVGGVGVEVVAVVVVGDVVDAGSGEVVVDSPPDVSVVGAVSVAVDDVSVVVSDAVIETIPRAPDASRPATSKTPKARTTRTRRSAFGLVVSPVPLLSRSI